MFLLELPDKTMIATIVMSSRARPSSVALGASLGFAVQMGIAVGAGGLLTLLPDRVRLSVVGVLFLAGAAYLLFSSEKEAVAEGEREGHAERSGRRSREILTAFGVIFIGEFGDLTQIQAANFVAKTHALLAIYVASTLALALVAVLGSFGGRLLQRYVPLKLIRRGGGVIFAGFGVATVVQLFS